MWNYSNVYVANGCDAVANVSVLYWIQRRLEWTDIHTQDVWNGRMNVNVVHSRTHSAIHDSRCLLLKTTILCGWSVCSQTNRFVFTLTFLSWVLKVRLRFVIVELVACGIRSLIFMKNAEVDWNHLFIQILHFWLYWILWSSYYADSWFIFYFIQSTSSTSFTHSLAQYFSTHAIRFLTATQKHLLKLKNAGVNKTKWLVFGQ